MFHTIQTHEYGVPQLHIVFPIVIGEMSRRRYAMLMRLLDENLHFAGRCLLDLDTDDALLGPVINLLANLFFGNVVGPADAFVRCQTDVVFTSKCAEVRTRCEHPRANGLAAINTITLRYNAFRIILSRRPG